MTNSKEKALVEFLWVLNPTLENTESSCLIELFTQIANLYINYMVDHNYIPKDRSRDYRELNHLIFIVYSND